MANSQTPPLFSPVKPKEVKPSRPLYGGLSAQRDTIINTHMARQSAPDEQKELDLLGQLKGIGRRLLNGN